MSLVPALVLIVVVILVVGAIAYSWIDGPDDEDDGTEVFE